MCADRPPQHLPVQCWAFDVSELSGVQQKLQLRNDLLVAQT